MLSRLALRGSLLSVMGCLLLVGRRRGSGVLTRGLVKSDHEMVMGGWTPVSLVKVRAGALREAAAGFIDWEVMYGREQATPEVEASHRSADYLMREADRIEGVVEWARVFEE